MKKVFIAAVALLSLGLGSALAQGKPDTLSFQVGTRGHGVSYRTAELNHAFKDVSVDLLYYGFPGDNEAWVGLGRSIKLKNKSVDLTFTPYVWGVIGKENGEKGIATGGYVSGSIKGINTSGSLYIFFPLAGSISQYTYLDGLDATKPIGKHFETGLSGAFFHTNGAQWDPLVGPVARINDRVGSTSFYVRSGPGGTEFRVSRSFSLKIF